MGLDTSHNCWHGPYSAFSRWRNAVAVAGGYTLTRTEDGGFAHDVADVPWAEIERENPGCYQGEWRTPPSDPLLVLIAHSDCDGEIPATLAGPLADRIEGLLPTLSDVGPFNDRSRAEKFVAGLRDAAAKGEVFDGPLSAEEAVAQLIELNHERNECASRWEAAKTEASDAKKELDNASNAISLLIDRIDRQRTGAQPMLRTVEDVTDEVHA